MGEGRPDYGPGDLVVCVIDRPCPVYRVNDGRVKGKVYHAGEVAFRTCPKTGYQSWAVKAVGLSYWCDAICFRKLDPLPPSFFTGTVDEPVKVDA